MRLQVGSSVYDVAADLHPKPWPYDKNGIFLARYKIGSEATNPRLLWCQDKAHVPARVTSFDIKPDERETSNQADLIGVDIRNRSLPDAWAGADWRLTLHESARVQDFWITDSKGRRTTLSCYGIMPVIGPRREHHYCRTTVALGNDNQMFVDFLADGLQQSNYLNVVKSAAKLVGDMRVKATSVRR